MLHKKAVFILFPIFFICLSSAKSQIDFFPSGVQWFYGFNTPGLIQSRGYTKFTYTGDIFLSGKQAKRLERTTYHFDYQNPTIPIDTVYQGAAYMAQVSDSIFYYRFIDSTYKFLWKFDVSEGEQFEVDDDWQIFTMNVDSVKSIQVQNEEVRAIWIDGDSDFGIGGKEVIYDKFGPYHGFQYFVCWGSYDCYVPTLCRYVSDNTGEINFSSPVCDILATAVSPLKETDIRIYPNPCITSFLVTLPEISKNNSELTLYNIGGELLGSRHNVHEAEQIFNMVDYPSGIYFCKIRLENHFQVYKIIKL